MKRIISLVTAIALLVLATIVVATALAADPSPQTVVDEQFVNMTPTGRGYSADFQLRASAGQYGIADIYASAALSETDQLVLTVQHSPDGHNAWVDSTTLFTFTAATNSFEHARVPVYGLALGVDMDIDGAVRYTPTIYIVLKNNAGQ